MKLHRKLLITLTALLLTLLPHATTIAVNLTPEQRSLFRNSGIVFYDPTGQFGNGNNNCIPTSTANSLVTIIGDSITEGASSRLTAAMSNLTINAATGRQFSEGIAAAKTVGIRDILVYALGSNGEGSVTTQGIEDVIGLVGPNQKIIFVTNYGINKDFSSNNATMFDAANTYENVSIADWAAVASDDLISNDGYNVHPTPSGYDLFTSTLQAAISQVSQTSISSLSNTNSTGQQVISDEQTQKIQQYQSVYEEAARQAGIPWQVLPVLHILEHGLAIDNPSNGQGIYQLYSHYLENPNAFPSTNGADVSQEEFLRQSVLAAKVFKNKNPRLSLSSPPDEIKYTFFAYNGMADKYITQALTLGFNEQQAKIGEGSPYVMNKADAQRDPALNQTGWGQIKTDGGDIEYPANNFYGAFVLYAALTGIMPSSTQCYSIGSGNGDINATAIAFSWPGIRSHPANDPVPEYYAALQSYNFFNNPDNNVQGGASCDAFVATVMRYSGADPGFHCCGTGNQQNYMQNHPELYEKIENLGNTSNLQPGDIFVYSRLNASGTSDGHIFLYVVENGVEKAAHASRSLRTDCAGYTQLPISNGSGSTISSCSRTGERGESIEFTYMTDGITYSYDIFRRKQ